MKIGLGYSNLEDSYKAGVKAAQDAILSSGKPALTIFFTTFRNEPEGLFQGIREVVGESKIIGATSEGIIVSDSLLTRGVGVLTLSGEGIKIDTVSIDDTDLSDIDIGEYAGKSLLKSGIEKGTVIIFFDKDSLDAYKMLYGLYNTMGPAFNYIGGGCWRGPGAQYTYKFTDAGINKGHLVALAIDGIDFSIVSGHGFTNIKDPLIITKTAKNRVLEIDGIPATSAYTKRLNKPSDTDLFIHMVLHPLGFPNLLGDFIIRDPVRSEVDGSILFSVNIPKGAVGYVMKGEIERLIETAGSVAKKAVTQIDHPQFCLVFDCISRSSLMKRRFESELKAIRESIEADIPILGMLTWGEISSKSSPTFHNKTTILAVGGKGINYSKIEERPERINRERLLTAELSILHEIASFFPSSFGKSLYMDVIEKTVRLFGVIRSALLKKNGKTYRLMSSWGFKSAKEVLDISDKEDEKRVRFSLGEEERYGILYLEFDRAIEDWERRIYTIFAKRLEEIFSIIEMIDKKRKNERSLRELALRDDLTNLYNRRGFLMLGEQLLKLGERLKKNIILIYIDIDNMKWINDNLGHSEGDEVLKDVAHILKRTFRKSDILARIGGDEFVFLGLETGENNYNALLDRINKRISLRNRRKNYPISLSMGMVIYTLDKPTPLKTLLEEADRAMYLEKRKKKSG